MPRRARFHTYPIVGRFAAFARKRSYLWSFRYLELRPAFYAGSILSLMPALGVQLPVAFAISLFVRTNFMVMGGLQFITTPVTAVPVYYGTYKLGEYALHLTGWGPVESVDAVPVPVADAVETPTLGHDAPPPGGNWLGHLAQRFRVDNLTHLLNCLVIGGLLAGVTLGALLDLLWRVLVLPAARHHAARKPVTAVVTPHDQTPRPPPDSTS